MRHGPPFSLPLPTSGNPQPMFAPIIPRHVTLAVLCVSAMLPLSAVHAQQATELEVTYDGQFQPNELRAPAGKPIVIRVKNNSGKAMEFESHSLKVEKVISAKGEGLVNV